MSFFLRLFGRLCLIIAPDPAGRITNFYVAKAMPTRETNLLKNRDVKRVWAAVINGQ